MYQRENVLPFLLTGKSCSSTKCFNLQLVDTVFYIEVKNVVIFFFFFSPKLSTCKALYHDLHCSKVSYIRNTEEILHCKISKTFNHMRIQSSCVSQAVIVLVTLKKIIGNCV